MADTPPTLAELRDRIDAIDTELARLIDERFQVTHQVTMAKAMEGRGGFGLRPARESQVIRRLLDMPRKAASKALMVRLWREIMGESLYRQGSFNISAWGRDQAQITELVRQRFGFAPNLYFVDAAEQALANARGGHAIAVLGFSRDYPWFARLLVEPNLSVFAVLPDLMQWGSGMALAVAEVTHEPSGAGDETLWVTDSAKSAWEIEQHFSKDGVAARLITESGGVKLFAMAGYYQKTDERLARGPGRLTGVIGVAPAAFDL